MNSYKTVTMNIKYKHIEYKETARIQNNNNNNNILK